MTTTFAHAHAGSARSSAVLRSVELQGPAGRLEALVNEGAPDAPIAALICHPHPLGGGTLHNKVVYHAMKALNDPEFGFAFPVLRFNFRGVGLSDGVHDGQAEAEDALAAFQWLVNEYSRPVVLVGFSFGAAMAVRACCSQSLPARLAPNPAALILLGLPTNADGRNYDYSCLAQFKIPKLFLSGDRDQFAPVVQLAQVAGSAAEPRQLVLVPGADHFFTGQLAPMQLSLATWLKEQLI
jgi:uncharacterized protein